MRLIYNVRSNDLIMTSRGKMEKKYSKYQIEKHITGKNLSY